MKPLAIDLYCGLGGWTEGLLAEGYDVIGFDIERHVYGDQRYPAQLVLQDVLTLHGSQFKDAVLIVASPPCQAYSYRAMPWKRAKALPPPDNTLFEACFRIQREACEAAGRYIPLIVENVRGAQKWVGRSRWNYGSYHLWGDVPALMPMTLGLGIKVGGLDWNKRIPGQAFNTIIETRRRTALGNGARFTSDEGRKCECPTQCDCQDVERGFVSMECPMHNWNPQPSLTCPVHGEAPLAGRKGFKRRFADTLHCRFGSASPARARARAEISKIPLPLARHIGRVFRP